MTQTIEMKWDTEENILGEFCPADKLDRVKYAQFLTGFLAGQGFDETKEKKEQKKNYVLNLNSEWGSGKTYFLKRWYNDLQQHYPVVYVDAWKQDYSDDPLMTVISSMTKQLREQAGKAEDDPKFKAPRKALGLLKAALPSAAGALAKRYLGIDPVAIMEAADEGEVGETIKDAEGKDIDMGAAASKLVQYLLDEHDAKSDAISSLKKSVEQWIEAAKGNKKLSYPAFIFIDELDRCRPSYAVEMLETIKHIFDIPGVVFVVGTDTEQLQHAVKAIYGEGFDARTYLGRFFNSRCTLKKPTFNHLLNSHCDLHKLSNEYLNNSKLSLWPTQNKAYLDAYNIISRILESFNLSPRQAIQITDRVIAIMSAHNSSAHINLPYLVCHLCLQEISPQQYRKWREEGVCEFEVFKTEKANNISTLCFNLIPQDLVERFWIEEHITANNNWPSKLYKCSINNFIIEVSRVISNSDKPHVINDDHRDLMEHYIAQIEPRNYQRPTYMEELSWIMLDLINSNKGKPIQNEDYYFNLVELSYCIDTELS
ncbi:P-loop NTPase fold protein [Vibrio diazotrophicus]|uniref:KAP family P-loop NTPase fold protein n=1 Tax=Vibrio diazotrophicus TaxID=685 RepID=UPI0005AB400F|nr:P-loop NTPase fold protein [Vibrio diazotrophicus]